VRARCRLAFGLYALGAAGSPARHRGFAERQIAQRLSEIGLGAAAKAVRALPQEDLVDVHLQNPVLRQRRLDLVGERDFIQLADVAALGAQVELRATCIVIVLPPWPRRPDTALARAAAPARRSRHRCVGKS